MVGLGVGVALPPPSSPVGGGCPPPTSSSFKGGPPPRWVVCCLGLVRRVVGCWVVRWFGGTALCGGVLDWVVSVVV